MKNLFLLLGLVVAPEFLFGQGQVIFANTTSTLITTNGTSIGQGSGPLSGNGYRIGLYVAPDGTTDESLFTLTSVTTNSSSFPGRFGLQTPLSLPGNNGTPIAFQVKAWTAIYGSSYEAAIANRCAFPGMVLYAGKSAIGRVTPAVGGGPVPGLFGPGDFPGQLTVGFELVPVLCPEPSTWALAVLGAAALLCLGRRRRNGKYNHGKVQL